jgi:hypothetical protein
MFKGPMVMTCARDQFAVHNAEALAALMRRLVPPILLVALALANGIASADPRTPTGTGHKLVLAAAPAPSAALRYTLTPQSRLQLKGTATIGGWSSRSKKVHGGLTVFFPRSALTQLFQRITAAGPQDPMVLKLPAAKAPVGELSIPVVSLRGGSSGMDHDMWHALKAGAHPMIRYQLARVVHAAVRWDRPHGRWHLKLAVLGKLTLAGVTRTLCTIMLVYRESGGGFYIHSSTVVMMRNFGVTPPTAFFGLIRGHNRVHVIFDLHLAPVGRAKYHAPVR